MAWSGLAALQAASSAPFWREGAPLDPLFPSLAPAQAPAPAASLRDPALHGPNDPPAPGTRAVPPPPEIMATEASSLVNRRIELVLLHNEVQTAQSLLAGAKAGGGGGSGGASSGGAPPSTPLLDRLLPDPVFQGACDTVGVAAALFSHGGAGAGGEREELDLIKKLALVLTQMKMERGTAHGHGTRASKW
jgi:hypothetical protein